MDWIIQNKEWLFSGLGIAVISLIGGLIYNRKNAVKFIPNEVNNNNSNVVNINVNDNISKSTRASSQKSKGDIQILFVDDEKFEIVGILKDAGWANAKTIKDVKNLDSPDILNANVIFVDVNGVGRTLFPNDQGLGLAEAIKTRNPEKFIIIYSAQEQRLHKAFSIVDAVLPKNADPYEFINILENYLRK